MLVVDTENAGSDGPGADSGGVGICMGAAMGSDAGTDRTMGTPLTGVRREGFSGSTRAGVLMAGKRVAEDFREVGCARTCAGSEAGTAGTMGTPLTGVRREGFPGSTRTGVLIAGRRVAEDLREVGGASTCVGVVGSGARFAEHFSQRSTWPAGASSAGNLTPQDSQ